MNIVVPMAGKGSRFIQAGYQIPKPFIKVDEMPMVLRAIQGFEGNFIFLVRKEHLPFVKDFPGKIITVDKPTEGAACTVLLAQKYIDNREELLILNSDQIVEYSKLNFGILRDRCDYTSGIIFVFKGQGPKWSYANVQWDGSITEVAEKKEISQWATCGIYYWPSGSLFVHYAKQMIESNKRVNGEFYVCPVYNELLESHTVFPFEVNKMWGLGTPEDLEKYKNRNL